MTEVYAGYSPDMFSGASDIEELRLFRDISCSQMLATEDFCVGRDCHECPVEMLFEQRLFEL